MLDDDTRRAYASRVRGYLIWLDNRRHRRRTDHPDPRPIRRRPRLPQPSADRRQTRTLHHQHHPRRDRRPTPRPRCRRRAARRPAQAAPRALSDLVVTRWLRTVERWVNPRDRVLALIPFYAGPRLGEVVALNLDDIALSARKGLIIVRAGKGERYREVPVHAGLRPDLTLWINDERPTWPGADDTDALLLNHRGARLTARGAHDVIGAIADQAGIDDDFTSHALRHTFGTTLVRDGHDLVLVAELMGHARLDQTRRYSLPTQAGRERAINSLPTDR